MRLSHSSLETFHTCERLWQIEKLLVEGKAPEDTEHTVFGRAYGVGIATYLLTQNSERSLFEAWFAYQPELESEKKSIPHCISALLSAFPKLDSLLMDYEVAYFQDKPAVELSFRLDITEEYYFVGHIDVVLRNRWTGIYYVIDAKTTGLNLLDLSPLYANSGQTLGYSIAIDKIVGEKQASYGVGYVVGQINAAKYTAITHILTYEKTLLDRLQWFMSLGLDVKRLQQMAEINYYPRRGASCLRFNKPCRYFGTCNLTSLDSPRIREVDEIQYDFQFHIDDLIEDHIKRIGIS